jgi:putative NADH-flavin reductase
MKLTIFGATGGTGTHLARLALAAGHEVTAVVRDPARLQVVAPAEGPARVLAEGPPLAEAAVLAEVPARAGLAEPAQAGNPAQAANAGQAGRAAGQAEGAGQRLRVVTADVMDPAAITAAVTGADAVLSAIGPRANGPTTVSQDGHRSIAAAMRAAGSRRLLMVSGTIVADTGESPYLRYLAKPVVRATFLRHVCADMRAAEEVIHAADLDWTIVRPPALTGKPARGRYRTAIDRNLPHGFAVSRADLAACMLTLVADPATFRRHVCVAN